MNKHACDDVCVMCDGVKALTRLTRKGESESSNEKVVNFDGRHYQHNNIIPLSLLSIIEGFASPPPHDIPSVSFFHNNTAIMRSRDHINSLVLLVVVSFAAAVPSADAFALPVGGGGRALARTATTTTTKATTKTTKTTTTIAVRASTGGGRATDDGDDDDEAAFAGRPATWLSGMALAAALWAAPASMMTTTTATMSSPAATHRAFLSPSSSSRYYYVASAREMASGSGTRVNKDPESLLRYGLPIDNSEVRSPSPAVPVRDFSVGRAR